MNIKLDKIKIRDYNYTNGSVKIEAWKDNKVMFIAQMKMEMIDESLLKKDEYQLTDDLIKAMCEASEDIKRGKYKLLK